MQSARRLELPARERWALYYTLLLKDLGCSSNAARICELYLADDLNFKHDFKTVGDSLPQDSLGALKSLNTAGAQAFNARFPQIRFRILDLSASDGLQSVARGEAAHSEGSAAVAAGHLVHLGDVRVVQPGDGLGLADQPLLFADHPARLPKLLRHRDPHPVEVEHCQSWLASQLDLVQPKVVSLKRLKSSRNKKGLTFM